MLITFLSLGTLLLAALVAWLEAERRSHLTTISRLHNDLLDERAAAEFACGIRDVAARNFCSAWDAEVAAERETVTGRVTWIEPILDAREVVRHA